MQWTEDMSSKVKYRIYPSLLDKFQSFLDADIEAEGFWNVDSETGEQKKTAEEIADAREQELLDAINRVPHEPIEAADKGTCFNELVDWLNGNEARVAIKRIADGTECPPYVCELNGFVFKFSADLAHAVAEMFRGAVPQYLCRGYLDTCYGVVELYGYADEILRNKVFDLKTTSAYSFGKFERGVAEGGLSVVPDILGRHRGQGVRVHGRPVDEAEPEESGHRGKDLQGGLYLRPRGDGEAPEGICRTVHRMARISQVRGD